jgi:putative membrane protein
MRNGLGIAQKGLGNVGGGGMILMGLLCLLFLAMLVFCFVVCIKYLVDKKKSSAAVKPVVNVASNDNALNILNERYAKGEIDAKEYEKVKANLSGQK